MNSNGCWPSLFVSIINSNNCKLSESPHSSKMQDLIHCNFVHVHKWQIISTSMIEISVIPLTINRTTRGNQKFNEQLTSFFKKLAKTGG